MGDLSQVMPVIHPYVAGASGKSHGDDYRISDPEKACVLSAKAQIAVLTALLENNAREAIRVKENYVAPFPTKEAFFAEWDKYISDTELVEYGETETVVRVIK